MECKEIQKKYIPFIDDELSVKELSAFLEHMNNCPDCREEYDIYYTMIMGIHYLEEDTAKEGWVSSEGKLQYARDYLRRYRRKRGVKILVLVVLCIVLLFLL